MIDDRLELLPHWRMDDRFQIVERRPGGEDDRAQGPPIDRAKGSSGVRPVRNHQGAKSLDHLAANLGVLEHLMAHTVGVDHDRPPFAQQRRDLALAAANRAGQTDHGDRAVFPPDGQRSQRKGAGTGRRHGTPGDNHRARPGSREQARSRRPDNSGGRLASFHELCLVDQMGNRRVNDFTREIRTTYRDPKSAPQAS